MANVDLTLVSDLLLEDTEPAVNDQLDYEALAFSMLKRNAGVTVLDNFNYKMPVRTGRTSGNYGVTESDNRVVYGAPAYDDTVLTAKTQTTAFLMTHQSLAVKDQGAAVPLFEQITKDVSKDYMLYLNRLIFGDGTGKIGTANADATTSTTFVFAASVHGDIDYAEYTPVGSYIKIGSNDGVRVTAITAKNTVTISTAKSWTAGDSVVLVNTTGSTTIASAEMTGFGAMIGTGDFQGINGSSNPFWQAYRQNFSAAKMTSESTLNTIYTKMSKKADTKFIFCNATLFTGYANLLTSQKRTAAATEPLGGGWAGLEFMGGKADMVLEFDCPDDRFIGVDPEALTIAELEKFQFLRGGDGKAELNRIDGSLNYECIGVHILQAAVKRRNALWELYNINMNA